MRIINQERTQSVEMESGIVEMMNNIVKFRSVHDKDVQSILGVYKTSIRAQEVFDEMHVEYRMSTIYEMPES